MKQADVKVGETYAAKVGEARVRVVVTERVERDGRVAFRVRREDAGGVLPKPRTAAALRPLKHG